MATLSCSLIAPALTAAGATASGAAPRHGAYVDQYHVPGGQIHSLAVDQRGGDHWLAAGRAYYTRMPGDHKADRALQRFAKSFGPNHPLLRSVVASVNGKSIDVVSANCSTLQVIRVRATTRALPRITPADTVRTSSCSTYDYIGFTQPSGVTALAHNRVAVLYAADPEHPNSQRSVVYVGRAGHTFARRVLPESQEIVTGGSGIARDSVNGALYVAELDRLGRLRVWHARTSHQQFREPVRVAQPNGMQLDSVAASHHQVWVSLQGRNGSTQGGYLVHRDTGGRWSALRRVPGVHRSGGLLLLAASPASKHASAWEANQIVQDGSAHGIVIRHLTGAAVPPAQVYSRTQYDYLEGISAAWRGGVHIGHAVG
jgi:hypothetical protein